MVPPRFRSPLVFPRRPRAPSWDVTRGRFSLPLSETACLRIVAELKNGLVKQERFVFAKLREGVTTLEIKTKREGDTLQPMN